jgi:hypothetical protein
MDHLVNNVNLRILVDYFRKFLNSHPFFHPKRGKTQMWGLWSIRAQLKGCEFNQKRCEFKKILILKLIHSCCMLLCTRRCDISLTTITICYAQFLLDCKLACFHATMLNSYKCKQNKINQKMKQFRQ